MSGLPDGRFETGFLGASGGAVDAQRSMSSAPSSTSLAALWSSCGQSGSDFRIGSVRTRWNFLSVLLPTPAQQLRDSRNGSWTTMELRRHSEGCVSDPDGRLRAFFGAGVGMRIVSSASASASCFCSSSSCSSLNEPSRGKLPPS
jgi:hypothetical protein